MKKWHRFLISFAYIFIVSAGCDFVAYLTEHNLFTGWRVVIVEIMLLGLGYVGAIIDFKVLRNKNNNKNKK